MASQNPYEAPQIDPQSAHPTRPEPERTLAWTLFGFNGRIPRRVYWGVSIVVTIIYYVVLFLIVGVFGEESVATTISIVLLAIPMIWISLAVQIKRWHDRAKSGFWVLINLIPLIGAIWAFIETGCLRGTVGPNEYGLDPT